MKRILFPAALILSTPFLLSTAAHADDAKHLYEAVQADSALKSSFTEIIGPVIKKAPWLKDYGTTAPPSRVNVDNTAYDVYWGCKPHDCVSESYTIAYDVEAKKIVAGAFVVNDFNGPNASASNITWLGDADWDMVKTLGMFLY